jgi:hypothetical protein
MALKWIAQRLTMGRWTHVSNRPCKGEKRRESWKSVNSYGRALSGTDRFTDLFMRTSLSLITLIFLASLLGTSCSVRDGREEKTRKAQQVISRCDELTTQYLQANSDGAKRFLLSQAALLEESSDILEPVGRGQLLTLVYFRLFALDTRCGRADEAAADLIKAQYWALRNGELEHVAVDQAIKDIKRFDSERILDYVGKRDRRFNNGMDASYLTLSNNVPAAR